MGIVMNEGENNSFLVFVEYGILKTTFLSFYQVVKEQGRSSTNLVLPNQVMQQLFSI